MELGLHLSAQGRQQLPINGHPHRFHVGQHAHQRQFQILVEPLELCATQLLTQPLSQR